MNEYTLSNLHSSLSDNELAHHGILGMHWGIRRYQPYGQGYDPDHEGRNIGLAARMAGHTGSYSDAIRRGSSTQNRAKATFKNLGKTARSRLTEASERLNYASDRFGSGINNVRKKTRSGLAEYAARYDKPIGGRRSDPMLTKLYESDLTSTRHLIKRVTERFSKDAKTKISEIRNTSFDDVKSMIGSGASSFQDKLRDTTVKSKDFGRQVALTASLLAGALDPTSSASQIVEGRANRGVPPRSVGSGNGMSALSELRQKPGYKSLRDTLLGTKSNPYKADFSPFDLSRMGSEDLANKAMANRTAFDRKQDKLRNERHALNNQTLDAGNWKRHARMAQFNKELSDKKREAALKELGELIQTYENPNKRTGSYNAVAAERERILTDLDKINPYVMGTRVDQTYKESLSAMEKRLLGL